MPHAVSTTAVSNLDSVTTTEGIGNTDTTCTPAVKTTLPRNTTTVILYSKAAVVNIIYFATGMEYKSADIVGTNHFIHTLHAMVKGLYMKRYYYRI